MSFIDYGLAMKIARLNVAAIASVLEIDTATAILPRASGSVVAWGANRLDAFVIGTDSALYHKWWDGRTGGRASPIANIREASVPDAARGGRLGPLRLMCSCWGPITRSITSGGTAANPGPSLTDYEYQGGICLAPPKAVAWGPNRLDVFVLGTDSAVYHKWWDGAEPGPSLTDYEYQGGICTTPPEVVGGARIGSMCLCSGPTMRCITRRGTALTGIPPLSTGNISGARVRVRRKWWRGGPTGWIFSCSAWTWRSITSGGTARTGGRRHGWAIHGGGICASEPAAVAWGPNRLDVFVLGTDQAVYHKWWDGANWGPGLTDYEYMGGICSSPPRVTAWGPNLARPVCPRHGPRALSQVVGWRKLGAVADRL